jgi:hypothetical protein
MLIKHLSIARFRLGDGEDSLMTGKEHPGTLSLNTIPILRFAYHIDAANKLFWSIPQRSLSKGI